MRWSCKPINFPKSLQAVLLALGLMFTVILWHVSPTTSTSSAKGDWSSVDSWICSMTWTWKLDEGNIQTALLGWWLALMAHSDSRVVVSKKLKGRLPLTKFRIFLYRLSIEIAEDELDSMKFLLQGLIPLEHLEKCSQPSHLVSIMIRQDLLREDNLDYLEELLTDIKRLDLAQRVWAYRQRESPGNVIALDFLYFYLSWLILDIITSRIYITDWKKLHRKLTALM